MSEYKIGWQKWYDPLGADINKAEWPGFSSTPLSKDDLGMLPDAFIETALEENDKDEMVLKSQGGQTKDLTKQSLQLMFSPFHGFIPMTEESLASHAFNFYVFHTNFLITRKLQHIVEHTPGVESLNILSPYRGRIAIGKMFDVQDVKLSVEHNLLQHLNKKQSTSEPTQIWTLLQRQESLFCNN